MNAIDMAEELNGERFFTIKKFALTTNKSEQSIRFLMCYGNRIRKLKVVYFASKPLIPYSELMEFPFTLPGRNSVEVYHYNEYGQIVTEDIHAIQDNTIRPSA